MTEALRCLFLDMNSYFASVEQQLRPELRGRPVAVAPVMAETTCCIAASYEAKRCGVRTGTQVAQARRLCKGLRVVHARPAEYVRAHEAIVAAVNSVIPVEQVLSIDEMVCRLSPHEQEPSRAVEVAREAKDIIRQQVGQYLLCSVGLAPNRFLSKVASNFQKPDGLTTITSDDLPDKLYSLSLSDLPGIGRRMKARLEHQGVCTVEQLCALPKERLREIWNGVVGERWWHWLQGHDLAERPTRRQTVGHSHVLSPEFRTNRGARAVLVKLIHKAAMRLRSLGYWAGRMSIQLSYAGRVDSWSQSASLGTCQDTQTMLKAFSAMWDNRPLNRQAFAVAITLYDLTPKAAASLPLFPEDQKRLKVAQMMDSINSRFGLHSVYLADMHEAGLAAPMRISFTQIPDISIEQERAAQ